MASTDRAFRALARAEPSTIATLLHRVAPRLVPPDVQLEVEDALETHVDPLPPPLDTDFVARVGEDRLLHVEAQGYDDDILGRAFWYHLGHISRHRRRKVETFVVWLKRPPRKQRRGIIRHHDVIVRVRTVVIPEVPASVLLADPRTACFAPAADPQGLSARALCQRTAAALAGARATYHQLHMAVVAAMVHGRYEEMVKAMEDANLEPVIIEDIFKYGRDRGRAEGRQEGEAKGRHEGKVEALLAILRARRLSVTEPERVRIAHETDEVRIDRWIQRAATAVEIAELFADDM